MPEINLSGVRAYRIPQRVEKGPKIPNLCPNLRITRRELSSTDQPIKVGSGASDANDLMIIVPVLGTNLKEGVKAAWP